MNDKPKAQRWEMGLPYPDLGGDWVLYEDYERLTAENERLRGLLLDIRKDEQTSHWHRDIDAAMEDKTCA